MSLVGPRECFLIRVMALMIIRIWRVTAMRMLLRALPFMRILSRSALRWDADSAAM